LEFEESLMTGMGSPRLCLGAEEVEKSGQTGIQDFVGRDHKAERK
jgi:hypothetical protein